MNNTELYNIEIEHVFLGLLIYNNKNHEKISEIVKKEYFSNNNNRLIYEKINEMLDKNEVVNKITLRDFFNNSNKLKNIDDNFLNILVSNAVGRFGIKTYAKQLFELYKKRETSLIIKDAENDLYNEDCKKDSTEIIEGIENDLYLLSQKNESGSDFKLIGDSVKLVLEDTVKAKKNGGKLSGLSTGFIDLDSITNGLQDSSLIILAARPSMGKSSLAINIAENVCKFLNKNENDNNSVAIFSLEMTAKQIASRILSKESGVDLTKIKKGNIEEEEWAKLTKHAVEIEKNTIIIDDSSFLTIPSLRNKVRRLVRKHNLKFIMIDYLQLMSGTSKSSFGNRVQVISEITWGLKTIAKDFNIPVLALSQLSRAVEMRDDKRPKLSDLRESGSIEQDADIVMFLYREAYYLEREQPNEEDNVEMSRWLTEMNRVHNVADLIIAKQRDGDIGTIPLYFNKNKGSFNSMQKY